MDTHKWLCETQLGYAELEGAELSAVADFTMIWSVFEAQVFATRASAKAICRFVDANSHAFRDVSPISDSIDYFQKRYHRPDGFTGHFDGLKLRPPDRAELVRSVLDGSQTSPAEQMKGLLIVTYRFRNNLFHGIKWANELRDQRGNFQHACRVITFAVDRSSERQ